VAKGPDRDAGKEHFFMPGRPPFMLPLKSPALYYIQRLRDEAHRFANGAHARRRSMDIKRNPLDEIEGVGPGRKKALLHAFGSAKGVGRASVADLVKVEPRSLFPEELEVGMQFEGSPDDVPNAEMRLFTVTDIADGKVVLDGNHPLAGMALRFALNVVEVRKAAEEEIAHGHVHGPHGHHHHDDDDDGDQFRSIQLQ
jgi:FKBP-type peptidyl-prolyl cis-trans isomerase 2